MLFTLVAQKRLDKFIITHRGPVQLGTEEEKIELDIRNVVANAHFEGFELTEEEIEIGRITTYIPRLYLQRIGSS